MPRCDDGTIMPAVRADERTRVLRDVRTKSTRDPASTTRTIGLLCCVRVYLLIKVHFANSVCAGSRAWKDCQGVLGTLTRSDTLSSFGG
jgi:hypothetical protein